MRAATAGGTGLAVICGLLVGATAMAASDAADPRLREVTYDPRAVVALPVKRGVVTLVVLASDEAISEIGSGLGGDCSKPESAWCIAAQPSGQTVFIKPKSTAAAPNNLAVVTNRRVHNFRLVVVAENDPRPPVYRLLVKAPAPPPVTPRPPAPLTWPPLSLFQMPLSHPPEQLVSERLQAKPQVVNTKYSLAQGIDSDDIVPTLVFDDGRFTYLRFPGNREVPAVFHVLGDGSETLVNARVEDDLLVVDRVSRRLMLRAGHAVVGLWNDAFDLDGVPAGHGTTVPGLRRILKVEQADLRSELTGAAP